jgi:diguanylate cyclase (GGDEF)-like protein
LAGRIGGLLFVGSALLTLVYIFLPGTEVANVKVMYVVLVLATCIGAWAYFAPWDRWHPRATLAVLPVAFVLIAIGNYFGAVQVFAFAIFFVVAFVWIGVFHPRWTSLWFVGPATVAYIVPIVTRPEPLAIDAGSVVITMPVCVLVAESLAWIGHRERQSRSLAEALAGTAAALAASLDKDAVLAVLVEEARRATGSQHGVLFEGDPETFTVRRVYTAGIDERFRSMYQTLSGTSYADVPAVREFANAGGPTVVHDTSAPHGYPKELIDPFGVKCFIAVPLVVDGRGVGILTCGDSSAPRRYHSDEVSLVAALAAQASHTIRNALIYRQSVETALRDPLTGLGNRRAFDERVEQELEGSRRHDGIFSLVLLDIDGFKSLNDAKGHQAGDDGLRRLASLLQTNCRAGDGAYRIGGDEFALVLPQTDSSTSLTVAERVRQDVKTARLETFENTFLTVSIGVSSFPEHGSDGSALFVRADAALYEVKRAGGDAVASACPAME